MSVVPFVDFKARVSAVRGELEAAVGRVLDSGWFILGREGEAFERELASACGAQDAVGVASGTEAIQLALSAVGVGAGDEVVTSPLTAAFTGLAILAAGGRPVFADVDPATLNVAPEAVARAVTPRTKALLPVHLYGHPADLDPLLQIARDHGLPLVEDACQAHGARYKGRVVGALSGIGALSFYPTKNLGALGDAGAILTADPGVAEPEGATGTPGTRSSAFSTSPVSIRKPLIFTWVSRRPRNSSLPSGRQRPRSPLRYKRWPSRCGSGMKAPRVRSGSLT